MMLLNFVTAVVGRLNFVFEKHSGLAADLATDLATNLATNLANHFSTKSDFFYFHKL